MTEKSLEKMMSFSWDRTPRTWKKTQRPCSTCSTRIVLQRLIVIARLPHDLADRTELGAHYERLNFQLSKRYSWDLMTGRLYIYPSCLLHIIETLKTCNTRQTVFECFMLLKVLEADQVAGDPGAKALEDEEETTETLVCTILSGLQKLDKSKKAVPGSVWDETPELIASQRVLYKLLAREELLTPQQHLQ
ncbi:hypothetical protein F7725_014637, partial [Dissostichus mawsoni]